MAPKSYKRTGFYALKRRISELGSEALDGRSAEGRFLREWMAQRVEDLGGDLSVAEQTAVALEAGDLALIRYADRVIAELGDRIYSRRTRRFAPVVGERATIARRLAQSMRELGYKRSRPQLNITEKLRRLELQRASSVPQEPLSRDPEGNQS
jgi:hypothetical protein